jgi:hypothetical protein
VVDQIFTSWNRIADWLRRITTVFSQSQGSRFSE